jgi:hypothetical protein
MFVLFQCISRNTAAIVTPLCVGALLRADTWGLTLIQILTLKSISFQNLPSRTSACGSLQHENKFHSDTALMWKNCMPFISLLVPWWLKTEFQSEGNKININKLQHLVSWDISVSTAISYMLDSQGIVLTVRWGNRILSSTQCPSFLFNGYQKLIVQEQSSWDIQPTTHPNLVLRLRMVELNHFFPIHLHGMVLNQLTTGMTLPLPWPTRPRVITATRV